MSIIAQEILGFNYELLAWSKKNTPKGVLGWNTDFTSNDIFLNIPGSQEPYQHFSVSIAGNGHLPV
jgi:hypothetical protein